MSAAIDMRVLDELLARVSGGRTGYFPDADDARQKIRRQVAEINALLAPAEGSVLDAAQAVIDKWFPDAWFDRRHGAAEELVGALGLFARPGATS